MVCDSLLVCIVDDKLFPMFFEFFRNQKKFLNVICIRRILFLHFSFTYDINIKRIKKTNTNENECYTGRMVSLNLNSSQGINVNIVYRKFDYALHQHKNDPSYNTSVRTNMQKFYTSLQLRYK